MDAESIEAFINTAIKKATEQIKLEFQPIIDELSNRVKGLELAHSTKEHVDIKNTVGVVCNKTLEIIIPDPELKYVSSSNDQIFPNLVLTKNKFKRYFNQTFISPLKLCRPIQNILLKLSQQPFVTQIKNQSLNAVVRMRTLGTNYAQEFQREKMKPIFNAQVSKIIKILKKVARDTSEEELPEQFYEFKQVPVPPPYLYNKYISNTSNHKTLRLKLIWKF